MTRLLLAIIWLAGACGDNLPDPALARSGERIKLAWYVYDDGTRQRETAWYYDSGLGERCEPRVWSDGHRYCTPPFGNAVFVESTCHVALGRVVMGTPRPRYFVRHYHMANEPRPSRMFEAGLATTAPAQIWELHDGLCVGPRPLPVEPADYYLLGVEITNLVRIKRSAPRGGGRLARLDDTTDDGLSVPVGVFDRDVRADCMTIDRDNVTSVECAPIDTALASYFADAACTQPVVDAAFTQLPALARQYSVSTSCWSYYTVGAEVMPPPLYELVGGRCTAVAPPGGKRFFMTEAAVEMPRVERVREVSARRLQRIERRAGDVVLGDDALLFDSELGADCERTLVDGELRCVPATTAQVRPFFAESQCLSPIRIALVPRGACDPQPGFAKGIDLALDRVTVQQVREPYTPQLWVPSTGDRCTELDPPVPTAAYLVGPVLDPPAFVRAELTIDP